MSDTAQDLLKKKAEGDALMWTYNARLQPWLKELYGALSKHINQKHKTTDS